MIDGQRSDRHVPLAHATWVYHIQNFASALSSYQSFPPLIFTTLRPQSWTYVPTVALIDLADRLLAQLCPGPA